MKHLNLSGMFGGVTHVPGLGYVQSGGAARGPLGDDGSVMMISGLGNELVNIDAAIEAMRKQGKSEEEIAKAVAQLKAQNEGVTPYGPPPGYKAPVLVNTVLPTRPIDSPASQLTQPITLFKITLPLWAWLVLAAALGGAAGRLTK